MSSFGTVIPGEAVAIAPDVHWVGALDPDLREFDIILRTPNGTSYNAYVVRGSEGVAVIDTVKAEFSGDFFARLWSCCRPDEIRAIVLNHLEPDHTGALPELLKAAPQATIYLSFPALKMLKGLVKDGLEDSRIVAVDEDTRVELGGRSLRFLYTPYLHWPDTQCTWIEEDGLLFSGDVFGAHFCDPRLFNDRVGDFQFSFDYYYQHIMRPFREHVLTALGLIEALPLKLIAPAHGPVLRNSPMTYVDRYRQLATPLLTCASGEREKSVLVFYISAYGNTARMAHAIRDGAEGVDGIRVSVYDLAGSNPDLFVDLIEAADAIVVGSPTINGDAVKPVWDLLSSLAQVKVKGKLGAVFGSFGWSGEAVPLVEDRLRGLKVRLPLPGLKVKLIPSDEELASCAALGRDLAGHLVTRAKPRQLASSEPDPAIA